MEQTQEQIVERRSQRRLEIDQNVQSRIDYLALLDDKEEKGLTTREQKNKIIARNFEALHQRYLRAKESANIDNLTQLFNRNYFDRQADLLLTPGNNVGALMLDVDFFKKINDTYGHLAGDRVLSLLSNIITSEIRQTRTNGQENDVIARYGGEEIIVLLPGINSVENLTKVSEKIRLAINQRPFLIDSQRIPVTVSIGTGLYNGENKADFLKKVDDALYEAKEQGRNQTVVSK